MSLQENKTINNTILNKTFDSNDSADQWIKYMLDHCIAIRVINRREINKEISINYYDMTEQMDFVPMHEMPQNSNLEYSDDDSENSNRYHSYDSYDSDLSDDEPHWCEETGNWTGSYID